MKLKRTASEQKACPELKGKQLGTLTIAIVPKGRDVHLSAGRAVSRSTDRQPERKCRAVCENSKSGFAVDSLSAHRRAKIRFSLT